MERGYNTGEKKLTKSERRRERNHDGETTDGDGCRWWQCGGGDEGTQTSFSQYAVSYADVKKAPSPECK